MPVQSRCVVLLAEDVDRNKLVYVVELLNNVVLLAEDVDRNFYKAIASIDDKMSSSSRRTWIEIGRGLHLGRRAGSSSSRRTWIEIPGARP